MSVKTFEYTKIIGKENIEFGHNIIIDDFVFIYAKNRIKIGNYVHIANFASIVGGEYVELGDFSAVSHGARLLTRTDDFKCWGFGNSNIDEEFRNIKSGKIIIGKFSIVGANSVILPDVIIGEGSTIGACSVVTKNLEPWGVYIGNKRVGERDKKSVLETYNQFLKNL